jgi:hypothetical protein
MKQPRQGELSSRYEAVSAMTWWGFAVDDATRDNTSTRAGQWHTRSRCLPRRFSSTGRNVLATKAKMRNRGTVSCRSHSCERWLAAKGEGRAWRSRDGRLTGVDWNLFRLHPNEACLRAPASLFSFPASSNPSPRPPEPRNFFAVILYHYTANTTGISAEKAIE